MCRVCGQCVDGQCLRWQIPAIVSIGKGFMGKESFDEEDTPEFPGLECLIISTKQNKYSLKNLQSLTLI